MELSIRSALTSLPEVPFEGEEEAECALCMETFSRAEIVRLLPRCGHMYHPKCIDRWLLDGQAHQRRRCPLCNLDPIETVAVTLPQGVRAGERIRIQHRGEYTVTVPFGVRGGEVFYTNLPAQPERPHAATPGGNAPVAAPAGAGAPTTSVTAHATPVAGITALEAVTAVAESPVRSSRQVAPSPASFAAASASASAIEAAAEEDRPPPSPLPSPPAPSSRANSGARRSMPGGEAAAAAAAATAAATAAAAAAVALIEAHVEDGEHAGAASSGDLEQGGSAEAEAEGSRSSRLQPTRFRWWADMLSA